jgi:ATP-dependent 26S proteasome regulatory subunit
VDVPTSEDRIEILSVLLDKIDTDISLSFDEIRSVALDCHAFVAADLKSLCTTAGIHAIREGIVKKTTPKINLSHLRSALKIVK